MTVQQNDRRTSGQQGAAQQQAQPQRAQQQTQQPSMGPRSFMSLNAGNGIGISRTPGSETLNQLKDAAVRVVEKAVDSTWEVTVIPIDSTQNTEVVASMLVICARSKIYPEIGVSYRTLVLEASVEALPSRLENINNKQVEVIRVISDINDKDHQRAVMRYLQHQFPNVEHHNASIDTVYKFTDMRDTPAVEMQLRDSIYYCMQELCIRSPHYRPLNLAEMKNDSVLTMTPRFGCDHTVSSSNMPVRSSIQIELTATATQGGPMARTNVINNLTGYMDLIWDPEQSTSAWVTNQSTSTRKYQPVLRITQLLSRTDNTMNSQLMTLLNVYALIQNNGWVKGFKPPMTQHGERNMHDIGATGFEANAVGNQPGQLIDTNPTVFRDEQLVMLCAALMREKVAISIDVSACSSDTGANDFFVLGARNDQNVLQQMIEAANILTNNNFSKYWKGNHIFHPYVQKIFTGYYETANGRRDIRDIDYLAVLNFVGDKDPEAVRNWSDANSPTDTLTEQEKLAIMRNTYNGLLGDGKVFLNGHAYRVYINPEFISALCSGAADCGMTPRLNTTNDFTAQQRAVGGFSDMGLGQATSGFLNRGGMAPQQFSGVPGGWGGRYR